MKKFIVAWGEYVERMTTVEAETEQQAEEKFYNGDIEGEIRSQDFAEDSLEIYPEEEE